MPTLIGYQSGALTGAGEPSAPYSFENKGPKGELSFGGKYAVSSDITVEATYNPDFSQVEADAGQIDVNTTFSLFYPERRPFFQEGSDLFDIVNPHIDVGTVWNYDGKRKNEFVALNLWTRLNVAQASSYTQYRRSAENFGGIQFDDIWRFHHSGDLRLGDPVAFGWNGSYGHTVARRFLRMGKTTNLGAWLDLKAHDRVLIEQWLQYTNADDLYTDNELYRQIVYRTRLGYQILRQLSLRLVVEYGTYRQQGSDSRGSWSVDPLLTYRLNPFSIFYVGSTHNYRSMDEINGYGALSDSYKLTSSQFFMKLQYLFQI